MARYTHLTIFQKSYDLLLRFYKEVHKFPKEYKFSLGEKLQNTCLELIDAVIITNSETNKAPGIKLLNQHLDRLRIYTRLCYSLNVFGKRKYEVLSKYIDEIGKMVGGWLKSTNETA